MKVDVPVKTGVGVKVAAGPGGRGAKEYFFVHEKKHGMRTVRNKRNIFLATFVMTEALK